jgi:predicted HAD superfamily Cof-like phosphohydrolase
MLRDAQRAVEEFSRTFGAPVGSTPQALGPDRVALRAKWVLEEATELLAATDLADQLDAAADIIYFALGVFVEAGIDGSAVFVAVHESNMAKTCPDGAGLYDVDGKVLKPPGWRSPKGKILEIVECTRALRAPANEPDGG